MKKLLYNIINYKWFNLWFYKFLFKNNSGLKNILCRINNHKCGVVWYSSNLEPDMHCENCGEFLG